jgi:hypothetical protein
MGFLGHVTIPNGGTTRPGQVDNWRADAFTTSLLPTVPPIHLSQHMLLHMREGARHTDLREAFA